MEYNFCEFRVFLVHSAKFIITNFCAVKLYVGGATVGRLNSLEWKNYTKTCTNCNFH